MDWPWAHEHGREIRMGWSPKRASRHDWRGYNEAMLVYMLALGSPTHPVGRERLGGWTSEYYRDAGARSRARRT